MPKYRIVSELHPQQEHQAEHRSPRGAVLCGPQNRLVTVVEAEDLPEALRLSELQKPRLKPLARRVISVEEIHPGFSYSDEEITAAFTAPHPMSGSGEGALLNPDDFDNKEHSLYDGDDFRDTVWEVISALRESGLVPGLNISVLDNETDQPYAMIEVHDNARGVYLSRGTELRRLTDDRDAAGWDGVLAIARELIAISNDLH